MEQSGKPFEVALTATRAGNLFTTHTPVAAGFDRFRSGSDKSAISILCANRAAQSRSMKCWHWDDAILPMRANRSTWPISLFEAAVRSMP